jgi:hypothetical protein
MTARIGAPKTGGRRRGSLDRGERQLVTAEMAGDILAVYKKLGGVKWLLKFAEDNPAEFLRQGLSRLFPAAPKDDEPSGTYNQFNIGNLTDREAACRVAFLLNSAMHGDPSAAIVHEAPVAERVPVTPPRREPMTPQEACRPEVPQPEPIDNPAQAEWAASLPLSPQERADQKLIRQTREARLETYAGSPGEQGGSTMRSQATAKPTVSELHQRMRNRRDELL